MVYVFLELAIVPCLFGLVLNYLVIFAKNIQQLCLQKNESSTLDRVCLQNYLCKDISVLPTPPPSWTLSTYKVLHFSETVKK